MNEYLKEKFKKRFMKRLPSVVLEVMASANISSFMVAGGFFIKNSRDIDIFFDNKGDYSNAKDCIRCNEDIVVLSDTKNAITFRLASATIQLCSYVKGSLEELVESFDYAHCQIGARVKASTGFDLSTGVNEVRIYFTDHFVDAMTFQSTYYTGSDYPLSSLIRMFKYKEREMFSGASYIIECIKVLNSIVDRGFSDYDDFKDQLDAVDLGLVPEELQEIDSDSGCLRELFELLRKEEK